MSYMEILGLVVLIALCIYTMVDRICKCAEQCHTIDAFGDFAKEHGYGTSVDDE